jgi:hypothetical protein
MISLAGNNSKGVQTWTPTIGEWNGSSLVSVGYTGNSTESWYMKRGRQVVAYAQLDSLTNWGVSSPNLGEWWMTLPVVPEATTTYRIIGRIDHTTYINRGFDAIAELTNQVAGQWFVKCSLYQNVTQPFTQLIILNNTNWSSYVVQFFGGYGSIRGYFQYEAAA